MRYKGERESENVEDRRGRGLPRKAGVMGGGALVIVVIALFLGIDPSKLLGLLGGVGAGGTSGPGVGQQAPAASTDPELDSFLRVVLASTEDVWKMLFQKNGSTYQEPTLTLFRHGVDTACGSQSSQVGPFYCPGDHRVYLDTDFFKTMKDRLGAPGDFAQAYVIAHEVGHHVQNLLGFSGKVDAMRGRVSQAEQNKLSVKLELQADFLAGVWAHHAQKLRAIIEHGDIEEAMAAAAAVGDDKLQREATGTVRPETFTHGTSEERMRAFKLGLQTGDLARAGDFF